MIATSQRDTLFEEAIRYRDIPYENQISWKLSLTEKWHFKLPIMDITGFEGLPIV